MQGRGREAEGAAKRRKLVQGEERGKIGGWEEKEEELWVLKNTCAGAF